MPPVVTLCAPSSLAALQVMLAVSLDNQDLYSFNHVEGVEL